MTTKAATTNDGAGRARRWLSRALVVAGGAIAATATAWLVSTAGASASTQPELPHVGVESVGKATDVATGLGDKLSGKSGKSGKAQQTTDSEHRSESKLPRDPFALGDGTPVHEVKDSVDRFWKDNVSRSFDKTVGTVTGLVRTPPNPADLGKDFWKALPGGGSDLVDLPRLPELPDSPIGADDAGIVTPALPGQASGDAKTDTGTTNAGDHGATRPAHPSDVTDRSAHGAPVDSVTSSAGDDGAGSTPTVPVRLPVNSPSLIPAPAPGGTSGGPHVDSPLFAIPAGGLSAFDNAVAGSVRPGVRHLPTQPGQQPGVTPD